MGDKSRLLAGHGPFPKWEIPEASSHLREF